ncbi:MAG: hypothetical protein JRC60_03600 [Deltaproteobacteria bacterium]|nr:hypothetical protein [Deltaproteobacteria bacterium]
MKFSLRFWIGIVLLTTNQPLGWGAMLVCNTIAINKHNEFFFYLGIALYALSWGMLGLVFSPSAEEGMAVFCSSF